MVLSLALVALAGGDLLTDGMSALVGANSISCSYTAQRVGDSAVSYQVEMAKPNKLRLETESKLVVADGVTILAYDKTGKSYDKRPQTDAELRALLSGKEGSLVAAFFDKGFASQFSDIKATGKKSRRGVEYNVVAAKAGGSAYSFFVDPADKVVKFVDIATGSDITLVAMKDFAANPKIEDSRFSYEPPADAANMSADAPLKLPRSQMPNLYGWKILPEVGDTSCCPTATANGLAWLSMNGFDALAAGGDADERAIGLARDLAKYYKTDRIIGTPWDRMFVGLTAFLRDRGYRGSTLSYYSWVTDAKWPVTQVATSIPDLDVIQKSGARNSFVMLALGWFNNPDGTGRANRANWHWATVADVDPAAGMVTLHDPYQANNPEGRPLKLRYSKLSSNTNIVLVDSAQFKNPDKSAAGVPVLEKYPNVKTDQFAVVEGVLVVKVSK